MEHVDGISIITLDGHKPHLVRSKIVWGPEEIFLVLTDPKDGTLYGYDEYSIEAMTFGAKNAVICQVSESLIREDEYGDSEGKRTVKMYLSRSGFRNVLEISQELSIPQIESFSPDSRPDILSNIHQDIPLDTSSDSELPSKKQKPNDTESDNDNDNNMDTGSDDNDTDDTDNDTDDTDNTDNTEVITEYESNDTDNDTDNETEPEKTEPKKIEVTKRRGWFSWLW